MKIWIRFRRGRWIENVLSLVNQKKNGIKAVKCCFFPLLIHYVDNKRIAICVIWINFNYKETRAKQKFSNMNQKSTQHWLLLLSVILLNNVVLSLKVRRSVVEDENGMIILFYYYFFKSNGIHIYKRSRWSVRLL